MVLEWIDLLDDELDTDAYSECNIIQDTPPDETVINGVTRLATNISIYRQLENMQHGFKYYREIEGITECYERLIDYMWRLTVAGRVYYITRTYNGYSRT